MKINWKVRLRHRQFWVAVISAVVLLSTDIATLFNIDITMISTEVQQALESVLMLLALFGIIIDPTTDGINDSAKALNYSKPHKDEKDLPVPDEQAKEENKDEDNP